MITGYYNFLAWRKWSVIHTVGSFSILSPVCLKIKYFFITQNLVWHVNWLWTISRIYSASLLSVTPWDLSENSVFMRMRRKKKSHSQSSHSHCIDLALFFRDYGVVFSFFCLFYVFLPGFSPYSSITQLFKSGEKNLLSLVMRSQINILNSLEQVFVDLPVWQSKLWKVCFVLLLTYSIYSSLPFYKHSCKMVKLFLFIDKHFFLSNISSFNISTEAFQKRVMSQIFFVLFQQWMIMPFKWL